MFTKILQTLNKRAQVFPKCSKEFSNVATQMILEGSQMVPQIQVRHEQLSM